MIKLDNISKIYSTEEVQTTSLNGVSLEIKEGEVVAIMGPSGCGKSTLLNIMGLIDTPTEGTYLLNGKDVSTLTENERTDIRKGVIGFVFQSFNLIDELNVNENVELPLLYMGVPAKERKERVLEVLRRMNMSQRGKHYPSQLSGGQQQRVAIARAVISNPKIILADEPTGNLDIETARQIILLLRRITESGTAVVMTTHNTSLLQEYPGIVYRCINQRLEEITHDFNHMALYEEGEQDDDEAEEKKSYYSDREDLSI